MRVVFTLVISISITFLLGCDANESTKTVEYIADGRAAEVDVAFIAPAGLAAPSDTAFVSGDSTFTRGDTTFVLNVEPTWRFAFDADDGEELFLRVTNRTDRNHVSAIIYVDEEYFDSDGSAEPFGVAQCGGAL